jgi:hypothetical protein
MTAASGILDHPLSRVTTGESVARVRFNIVIASEAKQSSLWQEKSWIASSLSLLAMTADTVSRSRRVFCASFVSHVPPFQTEGVGNAGCQAHPQPRVRMG